MELVAENQFLLAESLITSGIWYWNLLAHISQRVGAKELSHGLNFQEKELHRHLSLSLQFVEMLFLDKVYKYTTFLLLQ